MSEALMARDSLHALKADDFLSVNEAARYFRVSGHMIRKLVHTGELRAFNVGRSGKEVLRIRKRWLDELADGDG